MEYGINQEDKLIFCKNCGMVVATDGELKANFCVRCGAPLTVKGIELHEKQIVENYKEIKKELFETAKELETDSLKKVIDNLEDN